MKLPKPLHSWSLSPKNAIALQRDLRTRLRVEALGSTVRCIAGLDAAFTRDGTSCIGGVVAWDVASRSVIEERWALRPLRFPYIPGLLSFREAPALLAALRKLRCEPDVLLCDGHGVAHPRRFGIACHIGLLSNKPSIGCGKSRLTGTHREPGQRRGSHAALRDGDELLGYVLRTRDGVKPVYISAGHRIDLTSAVGIALLTSTGYRLPEPTRLADRLVAERKKVLFTDSVQPPCAENATGRGRV